ncbi:conserved hypothetical protein [Desulfatibacillum aliphaticivorans]|uniref:VTC domain-containing protein n=1 Tax=Desulfatibacillum aliphaticivorans TaxID=218208 RepID=B8FLX3_DESAL|nr:polyphosphate polymerase domain-containing protein [Desulfatibacillum aliphaticivorans]ACL05706.1 conserved hypothetical protein [Desulfatibacillum aliphaticivorans]
MLIQKEDSQKKTNPALLKNGVNTGGWIDQPLTGLKPDRCKEQLELVLSRYKPHSLSQIKNAGLMHRVDTKYLLPASDLEKLLAVLPPYYSVLEIDSSRVFGYRTTYFDTPEFGFYLMHHNGKMNRFKVRHRLYVESGDLYVEVKHKSNKRVTQKDRVMLSGASLSNERIKELEAKPFGGRNLRLVESIVCSYARVAFANEENGERVTLDFNLSFHDPMGEHAGVSIQPIIVEVKRKNNKAPSALIDLMGKYRQKPISFSKYCIGCSLLYKGRIKANRFKKTLMRLKRVDDSGPILSAPGSAPIH